MGLVKYGIAVAQISGKVSGNVFANNKGGAYVRKWSKPTTTPTSAQNLTRTLFASANADYRALSLAQQEAWKTLAQDSPVKNRLGETITLSGISLFIKASMAIKSANALGGTLPEIGNAPANMLSPDTVKPLTVAISVADTEMLITSGETIVPDADIAYVIEATSDLPPSFVYVKNKFTQIGIGLATENWNTRNIWSMWLAKYGSAPTVGNVITFRFRSLNTLNGVYSPGLEVSAVVAA